MSKLRKNTWCRSASIHWVVLKSNLSILPPRPSVPGEMKHSSLSSPTVAVHFSGVFLSVSRRSLTSLLETAFFHACLMYYWGGDSVPSTLSLCRPKGSLKDLFKHSTWEGKGGQMSKGVQIWPFLGYQEASWDSVHSVLSDRAPQGQQFLNISWT